MYKGFKKIFAVATAATLAAGALSLAACGSDFETPKSIPSGEVSYNGGFVVEKGDYVYFINGMETYTSDNTYGTPVRGALMRIKKEDVAKKNNAAETVIPSLFVASDQTAGFYIYGDRIYYTTPNNMEETSGELHQEYVDFKSAKLDGTDIQDLFRLKSNSAQYRFVEANGTVYCMYGLDSDLFSYNTKTDETVTLAENTTSFAFHSNDLEDKNIYYTMSVREDLDSEPYSFDYNQIYCVSADTTASPYTYTFDQEYVEENGEPYTNLGKIVLDGYGALFSETQYNHPVEGEISQSPFGYTYTLQSYNENGLYIQRSQITSTSSSGDDAALYFFPAEKLSDPAWTSMAANGKLELVAQPSNTSKANANAIFYRDEEGGHHYLYVSGSVIYRADVKKDGSGDNETEQPIAYNVSGAVLSSIDNTTDETYDYVYFSRTSGSGRSVERAVYNGDEVNYKNLQSGDTDNKPYKPVKVLDVVHANSWFDYELHGTTLYYCDADSNVNGTAYNYISVVSLANSEGKLMNNAELQDYDDLYNSIMSSDSKVGLVAKLNADGNSKLSTLIKYYFYTGETAAFDLNLAEAEAAGKSATALYSETEKAVFRNFVEGKGGKDGDVTLFNEGDYKLADGTSYRTRSYFVTEIGKKDQAHVDEGTEYWRGVVQRYIEPTTDEVVEETGLAGWAWALIGIAVGVVVIGAAAAVVIVLRKKKGGEEPKPEKMRVDTTDDRSIDVYSDEEKPVQPTEEIPEAPAEEPVEEPIEEAPAEEPEAPAEPAAEPETPVEAPEVPAEPEAPDGEPKE